MNNITIYWLIILIVMGYIAYDWYHYRYSKPKYRRSKDGYLEYKSLRFAPKWVRVTVWIDEPEERTMTIHSMHNGSYDVKYIGPGRAYVLYDDNNWKEALACFDTIKRLEDYEEELIYREDELLRDKTLRVIQD